MHVGGDEVIEAKLYRIPVPWDYHEIGAIFVVATSPEEARNKVAAQLEQPPSKSDVLTTYQSSWDGPRLRNRKVRDTAKRRRIDWDKIEEIPSGVAEAFGCND